MNEQGKNTDIEIWREIPDDYYSPSIHVTENGDIGINVGELVLVAPVRRWFSAGEAAFCVEEQPNKRLHLTALRGFLRRLGLKTATLRRGG